MSVEKLNVHRALKTGDCRHATPLDALRIAVENIEDGTDNPAIVYVALAEYNADGKLQRKTYCAGGSRFEMIGLLTSHIDDIVQGG